MSRQQSKKEGKIMSIGIHGPTGTGSFNVIGLADGAFNIQGNLTLKEIKELRDECNKTLKAHKK